MTTDTSATIPSNHGAPVATITTEQLFSNLYNTMHAQHGHLDEPGETLSQLEAIIHLMSGCINDQDTKFTVNIEKVHWAILLGMDLVVETQKRLDQMYKYHLSERKMLTSYLDGCHIIPTGRKERRPCATEEVAK